MFGLLRYLLAGLVVVTHLGPFDLKYMGYYAVLCFFTLSGYILSAAYSRYKEHQPETAYARFYLNRLLRVFPAYLAVLALSIIAIALFPEQAAVVHPQCKMPDTFPGWVGNIIIINSGTFTGYLPAARFIPVSWSLGVELIYWLALPLMIGRPRLLLAWLGASLVLLMGFYAAHLPLQIRYFSLWGGGAAFALGSCLYNFKLDRFIARYMHPLILAGAVLYYALGRLIFDDPFFWGLFGAVFVNALIVAAFAGLEKSAAPPWYVKLDTLLGNLAYPIFIIHITAGIFVLGLNVPFAFRSPEFLLLGFTLTNAAAWLIWRLVENPVQKIRTGVRGSSVNGLSRESFYEKA